MTTQQIDAPPLNSVVDHPGGYGIFKALRKIEGQVVCILVDPHTAGYANPAVKGDRYAVPLDQCTWAAPIGRVDAAAIVLPEFAEPGPVTNAWITPGKPEWWQEFEQRLIEATTIDALQQAKGSTSASRRREVMGVWQGDGRYEWLKAKAARLQSEANAVEQGRLGA